MPVVLALDLDGLYDLVEDSTPWLEAWAVLLALFIAALLAHAVRQRVRAARSPVAKLKRRAF